MDTLDYDVIIVGSSVFAAALARGYAGKRNRICFINSAPASGAGVGLIRAGTLLGIHSAELPGAWPVSSLGHVSLTEYDAIESGFRSERLADLASQLLIVDRLRLMRTLLDHPDIAVLPARQVRPLDPVDGRAVLQIGKDRVVRTDTAILTGNASANAGKQMSRRGEFDSKQTDLVFEAGWPDHPTDATTLTTIHGDVLAGGHGTLLQSQSGTWLVFEIRANDLDASGLEARDLVERIGRHPRFAETIPEAMPAWSLNYPRARTPLIDLDPPQNMVLDLSDLTALSHPVEADIDISLGLATAAALLAWTGDGPISRARLSGLKRIAERIGKSDISVIATLNDEFTVWTNSKADRFFERLTVPPLSTRD